MLTNARSLINKIDEFEIILRNNDIDIAIITETWFHEQLPEQLVSVEQYTCYRRDRQHARGGGVCCYIKSDLPCTQLCEFESPDIESLWILYRANRMPRNISHVAIGIYYHPPTADNKLTTDHILKSVDAITRMHPYCGILIAGDFNNLPDKSITSFPLKQIVRCATRNSSVLDKIYTNIADKYQKPLCNPPLSTSDHNCIIVHPLMPRVEHSNDSDNYRYVRSHDRNGKVLSAHCLKNFNWALLYRMDNCTDMLSYFYNVITNLLDTYLPLRRISIHHNDKPWVNDHLRNLIRNRQHAWHKGNSAEYRKLRNKVQRVTRSNKVHYYNKCIAGLRQNNPHKWWTSIKKITKQKKTGGFNNIIAGKYDGDVTKFANDINVFLHSVSSDLDPLPDMSTCESTCLDYIIEPFAIERKLNSIDIRKSNGPDEIPNWFLRDFSVWLAEPLAAIFNLSVSSGVVPLVWKQANVAPIPKSDKPLLIENDIRPISLTPTVSKILESFVGGWILECVSHQLDTKQFGSIKGKSTTHALVDILHLWHTALDERKQVRILFVDYAKAFDHVDHNIFITKLTSLFTIPNFIVKWLYSFLSNRHQRIKIGDTVSEWVSLNGGLPQGSWLAPLIFILFINDLKTDCSLYKYIDDTTMTDIFGKDQFSSMKSSLCQLTGWSKTNHLNINVKKTKTMSLLNTSVDQDLFIDDVPIDSVSSYKLLGVYIDVDLKWNSHIDAIYKKASSRLYFLKQLRRNDVQPPDLFYFYTAVVRPILEYACPAWHTSITTAQSNKLEVIQKRALSIIFGTFVFEEYNNFCAANQIQSLKERRDSLCKDFFNKSVLNEAGSLHHLIYKPENSEHLSILRNPRQYSIPTARTSRFKKSFLIYGLNNYT